MMSRRNYGDADGNRRSWTFPWETDHSYVHGYFPEDSNDLDSFRLFTHGGDLFFRLPKCPKGMLISLTTHMKICGANGKVCWADGWKVENLSEKHKAVELKCSSPFDDIWQTDPWAVQVTISGVKRTVCDENRPLSFPIPTATEIKGGRIRNQPDIPSTSVAKKAKIDHQTVSKKVRIEADSTDDEDDNNSKSPVVRKSVKSRSVGKTAKPTKAKVKRSTLNTSSSTAAVTATTSTIPAKKPQRVTANLNGIQATLTKSQVESSTAMHISHVNNPTSTKSVNPDANTSSVSRNESTADFCHRWTFKSRLDRKFEGKFCVGSPEAEDLDSFNLQSTDYREFRFSLTSIPARIDIELVIDVNIFNPSGDRLMSGCWRLEHLNRQVPFAFLRIDRCSADGKSDWGNVEVSIRNVKRTLVTPKGSLTPMPKRRPVVIDEANDVEISAQSQSKKIHIGNRKSTKSQDQVSQSDYAKSVMEAYKALGFVNTDVATTNPRVNAQLPASGVRLTDQIATEVKNINPVTTPPANTPHHTADKTEPIAKKTQSNAKTIPAASLQLSPQNGQSTSAASDDQMAIDFQIQVQKYPQWPDKYAKYADFHIQTSDGYEFGVTRLTLSMKSDVFTALFDSDMGERGVKRVSVEDISSDEMFEVLKFFYEGKLTDNFLNVVDQVYYAAEKYNLVELKKICEEKLIDQISTDSVCKSIGMAKMFAGDQLLAECLQFVRDQHENPQMPWGQLLKQIDADGNLLKEMIHTATEKKSLKRKRK